MENSQDILFAPSVMPDGFGGNILCPSLLTEDEAVRFLRLDQQKANPQKTLQYYREQKKLKATKIGKNLFYSRRELERFIEQMTV